MEAISLLDNIMQMLQENSVVIQWILLAIMLAIFAAFIIAAIKNFLNLIFGIIGFFLSIIVTFFTWQHTEVIAKFLSPNPPNWMNWAIPLAAPIIVFTIVIIIKTRIGYSSNQDDELELERRKKNHQLTDRDKQAKTHPKKPFFKQLFSTLFLGSIFISCLILYLTLSGKTSILQELLPESTFNLSNLPGINLSDANLSNINGITEKLSNLSDIKELGVLSQFILFQEQAPSRLKELLSKEDYHILMQLPIEEWLANESFKSAANQENNATLLLKIVQKSPKLTPEMKTALVNFEAAASQHFQQ